MPHQTLNSFPITFLLPGETVLKGRQVMRCITKWDKAPFLLKFSKRLGKVKSKLVMLSQQGKLRPRGFHCLENSMLFIKARRHRQL